LKSKKKIKVEELNSSTSGIKMIKKLNALKKEKQTRLKQLLEEILPENLEKYKNPKKLETAVLHHISRSKKKYKGKTYTIYELTVYDPEEKK
jgi:hypothetical protein